MSTPRLGVIFRPQFPPERLRAVAEAAERGGVDELWLWEDCFAEGGISSAAAVLAWTERLQIGIGVLPVPLRNVALTAMEVATLCRLFPGRLHAGVGHGVLDWMGQVGARAESPMTLLREYVPALRSLLAGETVSTDGRYVRLHGVALDWPPSEPPPLYVGAIKPRTLALAGELADGTILTSSTSPDELHRARAAMDAARAAAGRSGTGRITVFLLTARGPDAAARIAHELRDAPSEPGADVAVAGDAGAVADAVRRWSDAGADTVALEPLADDDPVGFVRFVADEVRPLV